jgi:hypothetical protein
VHPVTGDLFGDLVRDDVHGAGAGVGHVGQARQLVPGDQHRPDPVASADRAPDHLVALGNEQPVRRLHARAQPHIGEPGIVRQPRVAGVVHDDDACHGSSLAGRRGTRMRRFTQDGCARLVHHAQTGQVISSRTTVHYSRARNLAGSAVAAASAPAGIAVWAAHLWM